MKKGLLGLAVGVAIGARLAASSAPVASPAPERRVTQERPKWKPWPHLIFWLAITALVLSLGAAMGLWTRDAALFADRDQLASGSFALAGILGTMGGFVAAAAVFVGSASGPALDGFWRRHGVELAILLGFVVATLFLGAVTVAVCGIYVDGWFARGLGLGALALCLVQAVQIVRLVTLVLATRAMEPDNARLTPV
ncbi:MAG: hypothetical protein ACK4UY_04160 [Dietzia sp.]